MQNINTEIDHAQPLFIFGSQRSGTNILLEVLSNHPKTRVYNEDNHRAFNGFRLLPYSGLRKLVEKAPCKWVVFKSIMDSQHAAAILSAFSSGKAIWIYRDYEEVAHSAYKKWSNAQRHIIRCIAEKGDQWDRWYTENMPLYRRRQIKELYSPNMSEFTAGALKWYIRNKLYFDMKLESEESVLLVSYNRMVTDPGLEFERISKFLGIEIQSRFYKIVHRNAFSNKVTVKIDEPVRNMCDSLLLNLNRISKSYYE